MASRKKMTDAARQFMETGYVEENQPEAEKVTNNPNSENHSSLKSELLGELVEAEPTVRFTVDIPKSLHKRLSQLSTDTSKPRTEIVRIMILRALEDIGY
jgi:hypothetical protein